MDEITILPVPPAAFIEHWTVVEPMLDKAMPIALRRYLSIDVLAMMITGQAQGWFINEGKNILAVMVTQITTYPRRRAINVFLVSGTRMADWFAKAETILVDYGRRMGADHFECSGRPGWKKVLDLEPHSMLLVKDIEPMEAKM